MATDSAPTRATSRMARRDLPSRRSGSLVQSFGIVSLALVIAIGIALALVLQDTIRTVALGLTLLYLAILQIVLGAHNRIRKQADQNLFLANHDKLTGLLTRNAFVQQTRALVPLVGSNPEECTLLLVLNLERFQDINETLGHSLGDQLLSVFADRLISTIRSGDLAARIGGAEFGAVLSNVDPSDMDSPLAALLERLHAPVHLENLIVDVRATVGVVMLDSDTPVETALQHANVALSAAKDQHGAIEFFRPELIANSADTLMLAAQVRDGIENFEFVLHYQPKYDLQSQEVVGCEALVRWNHPERGFVPPSIFIPAVEHLPVGRDLANHVIDVAIRDAALWQAYRPIGVSVNLSSRDVNDPSLPELIADRLDAYKLPAAKLTLELTEGSVLLNEQRAIETLQALRDLGCGISIDDFGSGYASLSYLLRLPATEMKIDQSFIRNLEEGEQSAKIVRHCLDIAHTIGLTTVAEGIENKEIEDVLRGLGCASGQGYLFSGPLQLVDFVDLVQRPTLDHP